jgi:adenylate kinase
MLRRAVDQGTDLGKKAEAIMAAGDLVPDGLVVAMVAERVGEPDAECGYLLDGFPRNVAQAAALDAEVGEGAMELVLSLEVDESELMSRMLGRAAELGRSDDNEDTIRRRLEVYRGETEPLLGYYPEHGVDVLPVDGVGSMDDVFTRIVLALAGRP